MVVLAIGTYACAQKPADPTKYAKIITAEDAKAKLSIIASDDFEGRETGKPGAEKAANPFLRADDAEVAKAVGLGGSPAWKVFAEIRERKNRA